MKFFDLYYGSYDINVKASDYFGFYWTAAYQFPVRAWMIVILWLILIIYCRFYSFWMFADEKIQITQSEKLLQEIRNYRLAKYLLAKQRN
jgi:hypothetical protein